MSSKHQKYDDESKDRLHHDDHADDHADADDEEKHPAPKKRRKESYDDGTRTSTTGRRDTINNRSDRDSDRKRSRSKSKSKSKSRRHDSTQTLMKSSR